jgi:hypothetical protein
LLKIKLFIFDGISDIIKILKKIKNFIGIDDMLNLIMELLMGIPLANLK